MSSSSVSFAPSVAASQDLRQAQLHLDDDPRPSSTSVVATLRHSPRLLLRKKASALKEPAQSPDLFARGPGPALRASTRLQTRNASAKVLNVRAKKSSRQQQQQQEEQQQEQEQDQQHPQRQHHQHQHHRHDQADNQLAQYTNNSNKLSTTTTTTTTTSTTTSTTTFVSEQRLDPHDMVLDGPVQTRSSRSLSSATATTIRETEPSESLSLSTSSAPTSRILAASGQRPMSIATEDTNGLAATGTERRSRIATRSLSQTREPTRTRTRTSRTRAHSRTIPTKPPKVPEDDEEKSDEDDDDEDEARFRYHLRSPAHHRRRRSLQQQQQQQQRQQKPAVRETATLEAPTIAHLTLTPRLTRLGARHESGHGFEEDPDPEQPLQQRSSNNRLVEKSDKSQAHGRRSRSSTSSSSQDSNAAKTKATTGGYYKADSVTGYTSAGAQAAPRKVSKKKPVSHHKVPSLPASRRRLRARTTKVAKMGIDGETRVGEGEDEDDEEEDEEEEEEEDDDVDYDNLCRANGDEDMMDVEPPSSGLQQPRQQAMEDINSQNTHDALDGFIASKPEASLTTAAGGLSTYLAAQAILHAKRKVGDEDMEDAPAMSMDEGQVVSTKLARIDDTSDGDRNTYLKTFLSILKSPRGDDDDGILSSESDDADLESEDEDDDFEEIDIWEFIGTLPPLGPLAQNFVSSMPDRTSDTPAITLVLDIDETLVHCATRPLDSPDIVFPVEYNNETWEVYGRIRPGMQEFLQKTSEKFEVITFTASQECYAEALLKIIDPEKKFIKHRYYRDSCIPVFGNYIKDLRILNRDLSKVVIIDNSPQAFGYQISNGVPIDSWYDDKSDRELAKVMSFLESLEGVEDVRPRIDEHFRLQERLNRALAQQATHQQISSSMSGLGALGAVLNSTAGSMGTHMGTAANAELANLQSVPDKNSAEVEGLELEGMGQIEDATMMMFNEVEVENRPPSPLSDVDDDEREEENVVRGRRGRSKTSSTTSATGTGTAMSGSAMTTRSNLDSTSHLVSL